MDVIKVKRLVNEGDRNLNGVLIDPETQRNAIKNYIDDDGRIYYDNGKYDDHEEVSISSRDKNLVYTGRLMSCDETDCYMRTQDSFDPESKRIEFWYDCKKEDGEYIVIRILKAVLVDI